MIKVENLKKEYFNHSITTSALAGVSFNIAKGEFVAIVGPSGSGKSTLMHILGFLDRPTSGSYIFENERIENLNDDRMSKLRSEKVGFVFQAFNLLPRTTVLDNIKLPLAYSAAKNKLQKAKRVAEAVGLSHRLFHYSSQLSGGEKQRVAIARALVNDPLIILADEPTGNLDSKSGQQIMNILQELHSQNRTIILVTHEKYTSEHAERIIKLKDGLIESDEMVGNRKFAKDGELLK